MRESLLSFLNTETIYSIAEEKLLQDK